MSGAPSDSPEATYGIENRKLVAVAALHNFNR